MTRNSQTIATAMVGAVLGGLAAYLFFTEQGRTVRRQLEPALEDFTRELNSLRTTVRKASAAATEGWSVLNDALGDGRSPARMPAPHQTSPF